MVAEPAATPVTKPVLASTVATAVLLLLQVPAPVPVLLNAVVKPAHNAVAPVTAPASGSGLTVMLAVAEAVPQVLVTV